MTKNPRNNPYYRLNNIYRGIKTRCYNSNRKEYERYGGRGITMCEEWLDSDRRTHKGWEAFKQWSLLNGYTDEKTIDRIDNNKGYCPENCRWVSVKVQANNKRTNHFITHNGETKTIAQWSEEIGVNYGTLQSRVTRNKMNTEKALKNENYHNKMITYKGQTKPLSIWCKELNLIYTKTYSRLFKYHWSVEKSFELQGNSTTLQITYKNKTQSIAGWCRELKLDYVKINGRISHLHWSAEKAFETK